MSAKTYHITLNGKVYEVEIEEVKAGQKPQPTVAAAPKAEAKKEVAATGAGEAVEAPMPGTIVNVNVKIKVDINTKLKSEKTYYAPIIFIFINSTINKQMCR